MKKIGSFISILCVVNVLMLVGLAGFLWGTGRLDKPKAQAIGDLLRQPGTPDGLRAKLYDIMTPTTAPATQTQPATATAPSLVVGSGDVPATAQERIDYVQKVLEQERLRLENQAQKQRQEQERLADQAQKLDVVTKDLDTREKAYEQKLAAVSAKSNEAGFTRTMSIFNELKPKQIKDLMMSMTGDDVVKYISTMEPDQAAKIIGEFKAPEEKKMINEVLNKIRGAKETAGTGAASGNPATSPATPAVADSAAGKAGTSPVPPVP